MPWINGRFYANPLFGRALERARAAESGRVWSEQYPELGFEPIAEQSSSDATPGQTTPSQPPSKPQPKQESGAHRWVTIDGKHVLIHETGPLPTTGDASIYADRFEGKLTASGESFRQSGYTAALLPRDRWYSVPLGTRVKLTSGDRSVVVKINDRGAGDNVAGSSRTLDLSRAAAAAIAGQHVDNDREAKGVGLIHLDKIEIVPKDTPLGALKHR